MLKTRIGRQNVFHNVKVMYEDGSVRVLETYKKHPKFLECFNPNK